jgi:hypothetical protein
VTAAIARRRWRWPASSRRPKVRETSSRRRAQ